MKVLFLDQFNELGGAQLCLCDLLPFVRERGWKVHFAAPGDGPLATVFREAHATVHSLHRRSYANGRKRVLDVLRFGYDFARDATAIRTLVRRHNIDLVYVNGPRLLPAGAWSGAPVLFHDHVYLHKTYTRAFVRSAVRRSGARVIACSRFVAGALERMFGPARVRTVYNGVRVGSPPQFSKRTTDARIGMIARIAPEKGQADFVTAALLVRRTHPDAVFTIVGSAMFGNAGYERLVREMAGGAKVRLDGWTNDVSSALSGLDVLVVPSKGAEACPRVVLEAFAAGVPVVAYGSGGIPELVTDGTGVLVEPGDVQTLAAAVRSLIQRPEHREHLGRNGRVVWQQRFTVERFGREVCDAMAECAHAGHAA